MMLGPEQGTLTSFPIHVATSPVTQSRGSRGSGCNKGGRNAMSDLNRHALDAAHPTCHNTRPPPLPYRRRCRRNKRVFSHIIRNILLAFGTTVASIINIIYVISKVTGNYIFNPAAFQTPAGGVAGEGIGLLYYSKRHILLYFTTV